MYQVLERKDRELLFTQGCHHRRISLIFLSQKTIRTQGRSARTIALNKWYLTLFKSVRYSPQLTTLGGQLVLGTSGVLGEAYCGVIKSALAYLMIDPSHHAEATRVFVTHSV
jgi:hypothetical protein